MKCRVCGYEISDGRSYCPMCGTKTAAAEKYRDSAAIGMAWNTKDFPKPKQMEDIEMNWGEQPSFMKTDASEGSVTVKTEQETAKKENKDFEIPSFMAQPSYQAPAQTPAKPANDVKPAAGVKAAMQQPQEAFAAWTMPPRQAEPNYQYYNVTQPQYQPSPMNMPEYAPIPAYPQRSYTPSPTPAMTPEERQFWYEQDFTATGTMKTGPAFPLVQDRYTAPNAAITISPEKAASVIQNSVPDATVQYVRMEEPRRVPIQPQAQQPQPVQQPAFRYEQAYPNYDAVNTQAQKRPEQFNTFQAKNEEFQRLLDEEYRRINALRGSDYSVVPSDSTANSFAVQEPVKAQDVSAFERSLFGTQREQPTAEARRPLQFTAEPKPQQTAAEQIKQPAAPIVQQPSVEPVKQEQAAEPVKPAEPIKPQQPAVRPLEEEPFRGGFFNETDSTELDLDELISDPLDPRFNIDTLEMTIRELKKEEVRDDEKRSERRKRLAAMEAAREAYFRSLDEEAGITNAYAIDPASDSKDSDIFSPEKKPETRTKEIRPAEEKKPETAEETKPEQTADIDEKKEIKSEEAADAAERKEAEPAEKTEESKAELQGSGKEETVKPGDETDVPKPEKKEEDIHPALKNLYGEDEADDDQEDSESKGGSVFLKVLGVLIIIVAVLELVILALKNFLPDAQVTVTATQIELAVIESLKNAYNSVAAWVKGIIDKIGK